MKGRVTVLLLACAIGAVACGGEKKADTKPATTAAATGAAKPTPAPAKTGGGW